MNLHTPSRDSYGYLSGGTPDYNRLSALFRSAVSGYNFFTPIFLGYTEIKGGVAEISKGKQPFASRTDEMYGVTVVVDGKKSLELSTCFDTYAEVVKYVDKLNQ